MSEENKTNDTPAEVLRKESEKKFKDAEKAKALKEKEGDKALKEKEAKAKKALETKAKKEKEAKALKEIDITQKFRVVSQGTVSLTKGKKIVSVCYEYLVRADKRTSTINVWVKDQEKDSIENINCILNRKQVINFIKNSYND